MANSPPNRHPATLPRSDATTPRSGKVGLGFETPAARQAWYRAAYNQAVNADTWHLGDPMDEETRNAIALGIAGLTPPHYQGPDGRHYFHNARTMEDSATRAHRARYVAGKTIDQIADAVEAQHSMPGADEYVASRLGRPTAGGPAPAANDNRGPTSSEAEPAPLRDAPAANDNLPRSPRPVGLRTSQEKGINPASAAAEGRIVNGRVAGMEKGRSLPGITLADFAQAADDYIRLGAAGLTGGYADDMSAALNAFFSEANFAEAFAANREAERQRTQAARDRRKTMGAIVEMGPGFIPVAGDISGLLADFNDYMENGDQWTAEDWALVAGGLVPGMPNRRAGKSGKKVLDQIVAEGSTGDMALRAKRSVAPRTYQDLLPKPGKIYYSEGQARKLDNDLAPGEAPLGMIFVREKSTTRNERAIQNQSKAPGHAYDIETKDPYVPGLRYLYRDGRNHIRFDGHEITDDGHILLIDRKENLTDFRMIHDSYKEAMERTREALAQNNRDAQGGALFKVAYDFDDEEMARKFGQFIQQNGYADVVTVRVRKNYE